MIKSLDRSLWEKNIPEHWPERFYYGENSLAGHLYNRAWQMPDKPAIIFYGKVITYRELNDLAWQAAGGLQSMGVKKGDRVYLGLQNCPQFIISYFAGVALGAVMITGSPLYKGGELTYVLNDCQPKAIIIEDDIFPVFQEIREQVPSVENVIVTSLCEYLPEEPDIPVPFPLEPVTGDFPHTVNWQYLVDSKPIAGLVELDIKKDISLLQYTSGTTGNPKGAMLSHFNVLASALNSAFGRTVTCDDIHLCVLPLFHVNGSNNSMNAPILAGGTIVLLSRFDLDAIYKAVEKYKCTTWVAITPMNIAYINHPDFEKYDLSSLKFLGTGGAPLPQALFNMYRDKLGVELQDGFGMSETMAYTIANSSGYSRVGAIGVPCPSVDIRISSLVDASMDAGINEEGELWQRGPSIALGYWNNPEETAKTFFLEDDSEYRWLRTGDIVRLDEDGYLWLCGRTKEMIKVSGFSVYPAEVEEYLYRHPSISECCVIGVPHEQKGEEVKAFIALKADYVGKVTEEEIISWAREQMSAYKYPRVIEFRDNLPKGATGKVMRKVLKAEEAEKPEPVKV